MTETTKRRDRTRHAPSAEKVWRALTAQPLIEDWLMANDFEPRSATGSACAPQAVGGWNGVIDCEVLAVEPPEQLSYTWASMGLESVVTFTVTATAAGARLRMEQSGFPADAVQNIRGAEYGWNNFLDRLEQTVATRLIPFFQETSDELEPSDPPDPPLDLSIAFVASMITYVVVMTRGQPPAWLNVFPARHADPDAGDAASIMFVLPYAQKGADLPVSQRAPNRKRARRSLSGPARMTSS